MEINLVIGLLIAVSTTVLLATGVIFDKPKYYIIVKISKPRYDEALSKLFYCSQCLGFWIGLICGIIGLTDFGYGIFGNSIISGIVVSTLSKIVGTESNK